MSTKPSPRTKPSTRSSRTITRSISFPKPILQELDRRCRESHRNRSNYIGVVLAKEFGVSES